MRWIAYKDFARNTLGGYQIIRRGEYLMETGGLLWRNGVPVCISRSQAAKEHFAPDWDGRGLDRGEITGFLAFGAPLSELQKGIMRGDPFCSRYILDDQNTILFGDAFFRAPMLDLYTVCNKLGVRA